MYLKINAFSILLMSLYDNIILYKIYCIDDTIKDTCRKLL
jgi:hypothetical protein